jgi:3-hydroxyisobutyrate dehydrogenase-like beta-hydroxyacid dehydrogenase
VNIGIIGFGEVGKIFAAGLTASPNQNSVFVWDARWREGMPHSLADHEAIAASGAVGCLSLEDLCDQSELIFSAVTASNALAVAQEVAPLIREKTVFIDLNSASPATKKSGAALIDSVGGNYVDAGVMTSVPPYGIRTPILLGGKIAHDVSQTLAGYGMNVKVVSNEIGVASAIKMSRSIMIKGLEALVIESYTTARAYGVEDFVLPTLTETFPAIDWEKQGDYFFQRVVQHGKRRAEEMVEAARTVSEGVLAPTMTAAIAERQAWVAAQRASGVLKVETKAWRDHADALIAAARKK